MLGRAMQDVSLLVHQPTKSSLGLPVPFLNTVHCWAPLMPDTLKDKHWVWKLLRLAPVCIPNSKCIVPWQPLATKRPLHRHANNQACPAAKFAAAEVISHRMAKLHLEKGLFTAP